MFTGNGVKMRFFRGITSTAEFPRLFYGGKTRKAFGRKPQKTAEKVAMAAEFNAGKEYAHMRILAVFEKAERSD